MDFIHLETGFRTSISLSFGIFNRFQRTKIADDEPRAISLQMMRSFFLRSFFQKLSTFISRLVSHTAGWRTHVLTAASEHAGKCGPLFSVFAALRTLVCTKYVSSLVRILAIEALPCHFCPITDLSACDIFFKEVWLISLKYYSLLINAYRLVRRHRSWDFQHSLFLYHWTVEDLK